MVIKEERLLFTPADVEADVCRVLAANGVPVVDVDEPVYTYRGIAVDGVDVRRRYVVTDEGRVVPADADNETVAYSAAGEWPRDVLALARDMVGARRKPASIMMKLRTTFVQFVQLMTCVGTPYAPHGGVLTDVDEVDELLASVAAGLTNGQMATKFGTTRKRVAARLEELGVRNPTRS